MRTPGAIGRRLLARSVLFFVIATAGAVRLAAQSTSLDPNGVNPFALLIQGTDGNFYGSTLSGGPNGAGTVFQLTPAGVLTTLYAFGGGIDGAAPRGALTQGSDGNFYGTTAEGGDSNGSDGDGTVFRITPSGFLTTLHTFSGADGEAPYAGLTLGSDGNFYGTTFGGTGGDGTVFKITPAGVFTGVHAFSGPDGAFPRAGLTLGSDGNFYGTTSAEGADSDGVVDEAGTVFKITPAGALTTLYTFTGGAVGFGADPYAGLTEGSNGNFYGTTLVGGNGPGTVFQITPAGALTTLYSFGGADGSHPSAGLTEGSDGNFYGATQGGGDSNNGSGTIFKITPAGVLTTLYSFTGGAGGADPDANLAEGSDGNFYGATFAGGDSNGDGTLFKVTPAGVLTTLYTFGQTNPAAPSADLITDVNGRKFAQGDTIVLTCAASTADGSPLQTVNFYANGTLFASDDGNGNPIALPSSLPGRQPLRSDAAAASANTLFEASFQLPVSSSSLSAQFNLVAIAVSKLGAKQTSGTVTVTSVAASEGLPPKIALAGLTNGQNLAAGSSYTASTVAGAPGASLSAIAKIEYYLSKLELLNASVSGGVVPALMFTAPASGQYVIEAIATDSAGVASVAAPIIVQVGAQAPVVSVSALGDGTAVVGGKKGKVLVSRTGDTSAELKVSYKVAGTAVKGVDYETVPSSGKAVIPAGSASVKIKIEPIADPAAPASLFAKIKLLAPADGAYAVGSPAKARITILQH